MFKYRLKPRKRIEAKRTTIDGINFDSLTEGDFFRYLKLNPEVVHIDCHVPVTLPGGIRLNVDFIVYYKTSEGDYIQAIEIKGFVKEDFKRLRQLFDETHPLGPMLVLKKDGKKGWIEI
jgi:hypothetical protein